MPVRPRRVCRDTQWRAMCCDAVVSPGIRTEHPQPCAEWFMELHCRTPEARHPPGALTRRAAKARRAGLGGGRKLESSCRQDRDDTCGDKAGLRQQQCHVNVRDARGADLNFLTPSPALSATSAHERTSSPLKRCCREVGFHIYAVQTVVATKSTNNGTSFRQSNHILCRTL